MLRLPALLGLALLALSSFSFAQEQEDFVALNRKAIDALHAKKFDEGIAILTRMLDVGPKDQRKGTAYNLACAYALKGEPDKAFEWLEKSVEWGWGPGQGQLEGSDKQSSEVEMTKADTDLESLRKDPRFERLIQRMEKVGSAAVYIPAKATALKAMPILVVLHDAGSTKDDVVKGRWKEVADELGFALIAPSGNVQFGQDPAKGMTWYKSLADYAAMYSVLEKPVDDAVAAFKKDHPIDPAQVVVAGEGVGGLVALDVAINGAALYKGAVTLNGAFRPELYAARAPSAGKRGLRVALLLDPAKISKETQPEGGIGKIVEAQNLSLQAWGLAGETRSYTPDPKDPGDKKVLVDAIRSVLTKTVAAPAGAPAGEGAAPKK